jgi:hypothetical protein
LYYDQERYDLAIPDYEKYLEMGGEGEVFVEGEGFVDIKSKILNMQYERKRAEEYLNALKSSGIGQLVNYIKKYRGPWRFPNFLPDSYTEIARRLTNDANIKLINLPNGRDADIPNPYNFYSHSIYYCNEFSLQQWIETSFLADVASGTSSRGSTLIFIRNVPNITNIERSVKNAYLKYVGAREYTSTSGALQTIPSFDLLFHFD